MSAALQILQVAGVALLGFGALVFVIQRRVVFPGVSRQPARTAAVAPTGVTQVWLQPSFGRVEAWYFDAGSEAQPTVVFAHGNGELIDDWRGEMEALRAAGVNGLLVEFPGYGFSEGAPSRRAIRETFNRAHDWLVNEAGAEESHIVAYGRSLGGGAAADLAMDRPVGALALQSTFTSAAAMARRMLVPGFIVRDRFDNRKVVATFAGPVLLMHGTRDDVIPYEHAEALAAAREGLRVTPLDCAHNDCGPQWPFIFSELMNFLEQHQLLAPAGEGGPA